MASSPIIKPAIGFERIPSAANTFPAVFPPSNRNAELRKFSEHMNKYKRQRRQITLTKVRTTSFTLPAFVNSKEKKWRHLRIVLTANLNIAPKFKHYKVYKVTLPLWTSSFKFRQCPRVNSFIFIPDFYWLAFVVGNCRSLVSFKVIHL